MAPKSVPEALLDGSWGHLGPKSQQEPQKCVRGLLDLKLGAKIDPKSRKDPPKMHIFIDFNIDLLLISGRFWEDFGRVWGVMLAPKIKNKMLILKM